MRIAAGRAGRQVALPQHFSINRRLAAPRYVWYSSLPTAASRAPARTVAARSCGTGGARASYYAGAPSSGTTQGIRLSARREEVRRAMPRIEVEGHGAFEAAPTMRLVRAIEGNGVDILHRCGDARCTACRAELPCLPLKFGRRRGAACCALVGVAGGHPSCQYRS